MRDSALKPSASFPFHRKELKVGEELMRDSALKLRPPPTRQNQLNLVSEKSSCATAL